MFKSLLLAFELWIEISILGRLASLYMRALILNMTLNLTCRSPPFSTPSCFHQLPDHNPFLTSLPPQLLSSISCQ